MRYEERNAISNIVTLYLPVWFTMNVRRQPKVWFFCGHFTVVERGGSEPVPCLSDATAYLKAALVMTFLCLRLSPLMWS